MKPLIDVDTLLHLDRNNVVLLDVTNSPTALDQYKKQHLDGALFVDINTQLASIKENAADGGRHPLPSLEQFKTTLETLGIANNTHVVLYDHNKGANAAARMWWMLRAIGHETVQVLDGGFHFAVSKGFPVNDDFVIARKNKPYNLSSWQYPVVDINKVDDATHDERYTIIDVREEKRYRGEVEPIDLIAGHIPSAINIPFSANLTEEGLFKTPEALRALYEPLFNERKAENVIVHCGSGVTACHTLLAMHSAGLPMPNLYVGSWSEWSRNSKPIVQEKVTGKGNKFPTS